MKLFRDFGKSRVFHGSCIDLLKETSDNSHTTIIADWPFKEYRSLLTDVVNNSVRALCDGGTFISVHYPDCNYYIRKECEDNGLVFGDEVGIRTKVSYVMNKNQLPKQKISILTMIKGSIENRKWNHVNKINTRILDSDSMNIPTDFWADKMFKNGYKDSSIGKHCEAMPRWVVDKMLNIFVPKDGTVLDLFGGAGTVLIKCKEQDIKCTSCEIEEYNCNLIVNRMIFGH